VGPVVFGRNARSRAAQSFDAGKMMPETRFAMLPSRF
jgi:hypothetical protein